MTALVLEGGSLRGLYTAGVLDILLENSITFDAVYGVSAGSLNAMSFLSGQPGRSARINFEYVNDPRYMSTQNLQKTGDYFGFSFIMGELAKDLIPFNEKAMQNNPAKFYAVAVELETGKTAFLEKSEVDISKAVVASSSLPFIALPKEVSGIKYMDGGLSCPIPFDKALEDGAEKILVVTTREKGFRKKKKSDEQIKKEQDYYKKYPAFVDMLEKTPDVYNRQLERLDRLEAEGKVFVIYPQEPIDIEGQERNVDKLKELYRKGRKDMTRQLAPFLEYMRTP